MEMRGSVFLHDENELYRLLFRPGFIPGRLRRYVEAPLLLIFFQAHDFFGLIFKAQGFSFCFIQDDNTSRTAAISSSLE